MTAPVSFDRAELPSSDFDVDAEAPLRELRGDLLPEIRELQSSGDLGAAIAAMLLEAGRDARRIARASREAAMNAEQAAHQRKIEAMKDAATQRLLGGLTAGTTTCASGMATIGGGLQPNALEADKWRGAAKSFEGGGTIGRSVFESEGACFDRDVEKEERVARQAGRRAEAAGDDVEDADDLVRRALDAYQQYVGTKDATAKATFLRA